MISALIGAVVMSAVTVAMLLAVDVTDKALLKVGKYPLTTMERKILIDKYADMWGEKWYMLINPMYGEWEEALYEHCWSCYPEENDRVNQRLKALE